MRTLPERGDGHGGARLSHRGSRPLPPPPKDRPRTRPMSSPLLNHLSDRPILFVDVDGVISLFGFAPGAERMPGPLHWVDGIAHCIPADVGERLVRLAERFELVWATGWEERANEHLPHILRLPFCELPSLTFDGRAVFGRANWKLDAIDEFAGGRSAAWVDDSCMAWAERRRAPTLIVRTDPAVGLTDEHVERLLRWADAIR
jgi:HAD domain in Swiss Army Knife RNA repair proteins